MLLQLPLLLLMDELVFCALFDVLDCGVEADEGDDDEVVIDDCAEY